MARMKRQFKLTGSREGTSCTLGGYKFVQGVMDYTGSEKDVENLLKYLTRNWSVELVPMGSEQGDEESFKQPEPAADEVPSVAQTHTNDKLAKAVAALDHAVAEHWTKDGKPNLHAVGQFYGSTNITRADVEAAAPGLRRSKENG